MKAKRIELLNCDKRVLEIILQGDEHISNKLKIKVPEDWSEFGRDIFKYSLDKLADDPSIKEWLSYLPIDTRTRTLLGSCGYKGAPNEEGMVEIGYEVAKLYRNQGYATEMAGILIENAFKDKQVKKIQAHTLPEENASVRVLKKCNFEFIEAYEEEEDGLVWKWSLNK